jgi:NAD(P)-dependent dehydrogenase (short-subunit alcohol dehydrogenase family)
MRKIMQGRVCLVTGAARGMGKVTALELAGMGASVILVDWEGEEGTRTRDLINAKAGRRAAEFIYCDLSSLSQVRRLAAGIQAAWPALHVLVNNAGITDPVRRLSEDGWEMHLATCHLGHFLLTHLLLDLMERSAPARIINISSDAHKAGPGLDFDDLNNEKIWKGRSFSNNAAFQAYHRGKLCNIYFTLELAERLDGTGVTVNAVSPGYFVNTSIYRNMRGLFKVGAGAVFGIGTLLGLNTPEKGARTHIHCAAAPELEAITGKYWAYCREAEPSALARDPDIRERIWNWSEEATGLKPASPDPRPGAAPFPAAPPAQEPPEPPGHPESP